MLRHTSHNNTRTEEQCCLQGKRGLIMQEMLPPVCNNKFGQQYGERVFGVQLVYGVNIIEQWTCERAIGRLDNHQFGFLCLVNVWSPTLPSFATKTCISS